MRYGGCLGSRVEDVVAAGDAYRASPVWDDAVAARGIEGQPRHVQALRKLFLGELPRARDDVAAAIRDGDLESLRRRSCTSCAPAAASSARRACDAAVPRVAGCADVRRRARRLQRRASGHLVVAGLERRLGTARPSLRTLPRHAAQLGRATPTTSARARPGGAAAPRATRGAGRPGRRLGRLVGGQREQAAPGRRAARDRRGRDRSAGGAARVRDPADSARPDRSATPSPSMSKSNPEPSASSRSRSKRRSVQASGRLLAQARARAAIERRTARRCGSLRGARRSISSLR